MVLLAGAVVLGAMIGPAGGITSANWDIIWNIRLPRVVLAGIVGAMLSLAGASYQGVFRNPLVDPYLLGAAAGAGLGATLVFAYGRTATSRLAGGPPATGRLRRCARRRCWSPTSSVRRSAAAGSAWCWPASRWPRSAPRCSSTSSCGTAT